MSHAVCASRRRMEPLVLDAHPMTPGKFLRRVVLCAILAGPAGGLLFGLLNAGDPDPNPVGRVVHAFLMAALTPVHAGFPPNPAAGPGATFNVWPHVGVAFALMLGFCVLRERRSRARHPA